MATETLVTTKLPIGPVRFSYMHILEPHSVEEGQDKKYSVSLIIPKSDVVGLRKVKAAIEAAKEAGKTKFGGKVPAKLKLPLRDGDEERPDDEVYKNAYFINATSRTKPYVVDKNRNEILEKDEVYSGCYGFASINFYAFNTSGNKGIACGLNGIMKTKDGEPLGGGRSNPEDDFAEIAEEDDDFMN